MNIRRQLILDKHLNGVDYNNGHELNSAIIAAMEEYKDEVINKNDSIHIVSGCCTDGKHRRHITEKELKLAAKEVRLERGLIEYLINKVRKMQVNSGNDR